MQINKSKQLEFLANDVAILETMFANRDGNWLTLPGKYMPDGKDFKVSLEGVKEMTGELRMRLVETVRDQYDARETEQNAPKVRPEDAPAADNGGTDTDTGDTRPSRVSASAAVPEPEIGLEETLRERESYFRSELERAEHQLGLAREKRNKVQRQLREIELCINALQSASPPTSESSKPSTEKTGQQGGSTRGGRKGSRKRTTRNSKKSSEASRD